MSPDIQQPNLPVADEVDAAVTSPVAARLLKTSHRETQRVIGLLGDIYADHGLGKYFDQMRGEYCFDRYGVRLALCPVLFGLALVLGVAFGG